MKNGGWNEFVEKLVQDLPGRLSGRFAHAEIRIREIHGPGGAYRGLIVSTDRDEGIPIVNLEEYYSLYKDGTDWDSLMYSMADFIENFSLVPDMRWLHHYDNVKDSLFLKLCDAKRSEPWLKDVPHRTVEGLAITCRVRLDVQCDGICSISVNNGMLEQYGISEEQLLEDAELSSQRMFPILIEPLENMVQRWLPDFGGLIYSPVMVLSNQSLMNGAAALFYPGSMDIAAALIKGGYYILPSSIHEVILVPDCLDMNCRDLEEMVRKINRTQVAPEELLTDQVYHYDRECRRFETGRAFERRTRPGRAADFYKSADGRFGPA